jgi:pyridoxine 5-phosphate synthase
MQSNLSKLCKDHNIEFNLEGNPFSMPKGDFIGFQDLCAQAKPEQVTLVPDDLQQITSDHGWQPGFLDNKLRSFIGYLKDTNARTSLFIDANVGSVEYAKKLALIGLKFIQDLLLIF